MEALYDRVLDLLHRLRAEGHGETADALLAAMTQACNQREILAELRYTVSEVAEEGLPPELVQAKRDLLAEVEVQWRDLP
ncbi:MAG TPA: hypothetical protein VFF77_03910 [Holophagaceae bacterium]|nr:hypothetical protein [Holophagaceae bacterium]